jgi:hypothetical protein
MNLKQLVVMSAVLEVVPFQCASQNGNIPVPETVEQERYYISGSKKS